MYKSNEFNTFPECVQSLLLDERAKNNSQALVLTKYLRELGAKSYIIEKDYVDAGYLIDYSQYYSRCRSDYERRTNRIHFFNTEFQELDENIEDWVGRGEKKESISAAYLGFVVIKPLPQTIIGRTCLATYVPNDDVENRTRNYPIRRAYHVTFMGIAMSIKTVAFQEQDSEISACATAAIWFTLHGMPKKITTTEIPSTYDITKFASTTYSKRAGGVARKFPTGGLSLEQIEAYLRSLDLECIVCGIRPDEGVEKIKDYASTYVAGGYPMIMIGAMYSSTKQERDYKPMGLHAVTVLGYSKSNKTTKGNESILLERIYAHDDNIGPFTSYQFKTCKAGEFLKSKTKDRKESVQELESRINNPLNPPPNFEADATSYLENNSGVATTGEVFRKLVPKHLIIPINHKVRLPCEVPTTVGTQIYLAYEKKKHITFEPGQSPDVSWGVTLVEASRMQEEIANTKSIKRDEEFHEMLLIPFPKYIWKLSFSRVDGERSSPWLDILIDATDLLQGGGVVAAIPHNNTPDSSAFHSILIQATRDWVKRYPNEISEQAAPIIHNLYRAFVEAPQ